MRCLAALIACATIAVAQPPAGVAAARNWLPANRSQVLGELSEFLKLPNIARDSANIRRNAAWIEQAFGRRGVRTRLLEVPGAPPVVFGERATPGAATTVVFYAHYDGQPVDEQEWRASGPWEPSLRGGSAGDPEARLYARSSSDDKAPIVAMAAALDALAAAGVQPTVNLKFVFEGEEEAGSAHLGEILRRNRELLDAGFWLICDGPVHQSRRQQIYFGARGVTGFELTVYGPRRELHSGHYGNWALNPALELARLLSSFKDETGRVRVAGFYDGVEPLSPAEVAALKAEPAVDGALRRELWLGGVESGGRSLSEALQQPSLNIRGLEAAAVGAAARNVIPSLARASADIRLVKGNDPRAMIEKVKAHIRAQGFLLVEGREPSESERMSAPRVARLDAREGGYRAVRTPMDLPASRRVIAAVEAAAGETVRMPTLGGSVPLAYIEDIFAVPLIGVPIVNHDNSQHSHNENLRLANLWSGIEVMAALFTMR